MDASAPLAAACTLVAVGLGAWLSGRAQRRLMDEQERRETRQRLNDAYTELIAAYVSFRRYVMLFAPDVRLIDVGDGGPATPVVSGAGAHWERMAEAEARVMMLGAPRSVGRAITSVRHTLDALVRARAESALGALPRGPVDAARAAEMMLDRVARRHVHQAWQPGPEPLSRATPARPRPPSR